jgi:hypothetical protein
LDRIDGSGSAVDAGTDVEVGVDQLDIQQEGGKSTAVEVFRNPAEDVGIDAQEVVGPDRVLSKEVSDDLDEEECSDNSNRD